MLRSANHNYQQNGTARAATLRRHCVWLYIVKGLGAVSGFLVLSAASAQSPVNLAATPELPDTFFCPAHPDPLSPFTAILRSEHNLGEGRATSVHPKLGPLYARADQILGATDEQVSLEGRAELRRDGLALRADQILYGFVNDTAQANGHVHLSQGGLVFEGSSLNLHLEAQTGRMPDATYVYPPRNASGTSGLVEFLSADSFRLNKATYTTCSTSDPSWWVKADRIDVDETDHSAVARDTTLYFQDKPVFWWPGQFQFPLGYERRSGLLTPGFGQTSHMGAVFSVPYYVNIAPNRDYTITPEIMPSHGVTLDNEFRFMEPNIRGVINYNIMPHDRSTGTARSLASVQSNMDLAAGVRVDVNYNRVSDDTYLTDFSRNIYSAAQEVLPQDMVMAYHNDNWNGSLRVSKSQTLVSLLAPTDPGPYQRVPDLTVNYARSDWHGFDLGLGLDATRFTHPSSNPCYQPPASVLIASSLTNCPSVQATPPYVAGWFTQNGSRFVANPSVSFPLENTAAFFIPRLQWHYTAYSLDPNFNQGAHSATRSLPMTSLDAGIVLERSANWLGADARQTLEPRLFYAFVPYRSQSRLPNYDSADADFNFAQLFTENTFTGSDRIAQANQVTSALTTRIIDDATGAERLRLALGQRFYFSHQNVTLPGDQPRTSKASDSLFLGSASLGRKWNLEMGIDYDNQTSSTAEAHMGFRWQPAPSSVLNLVYHYESAALTGTGSKINQPRLSAQWPLTSHWYGVGVVDYSVSDRALSQGVGGFEYKADCWVARIALSRYAVPLPNSVGLSNSYNTTFFIQIEFNGLTPVGYNNPLDVLQSNIPGYQRINPPMAPAGPFDHYQ